MAALTLLTGVSGAAGLALVVRWDPTLPGGGSLVFSVFGLVLVLHALSGGLLALLGYQVRRGEPAGRLTVSVFMALWLLSPLLPFALFVLYALWGDERSREWFAAVAKLRELEGQGGDPGRAASGDATASR